MSPSDRLRRAFESDALGYPDGVDRDAVLRALDRERIDEAAPDLPAVRRARIVKIREAIRRGTYATPAKMEIALEKVLDELGRPRRLAR